MGRLAKRPCRNNLRKANHQDLERVIEPKRMAEFVPRCFPSLNVVGNCVILLPHGVKPPSVFSAVTTNRPAFRAALAA